MELQRYAETPIFATPCYIMTLSKIRSSKIMSLLSQFVER